MDLTPKRLRRLDIDPLTGLKPARNSGNQQPAEQKRSYESSVPSCCDELEDGLTTHPRKAHRSTSAPSQATLPWAVHGGTAIPRIVQRGIALAAAGSADPSLLHLPVDYAPEAPFAAPTTADPTAGLLIVKEAGDSSLEFELGGDIYRVKDVSTFMDVVAKGAQRTKQPRRTLSDLKRAQRLAWAREAAPVEASAATRKPLPRASGLMRPAEAQALAAAAGRAADTKLFQAWCLAKEVFPSEELAASDAEL